jgi:hypothetical protein
MVHFAVTSLVGLLALLKPAAAAPQRKIGASDSTTCIADGKMYRSGHSYRMNGINYVVRCAKDSSGSSFRTHKVPFGGFSVCFEVCERTSGCAGFSFVGSKEGGNCYLKASIGGYVTASDETVTCEKDPGGSGDEPEPMPSSHDSYHGPVHSSTTVPHSSTSDYSSSTVSSSVSSHSSYHHSSHGSVSSSTTVPHSSTSGHSSSSVSASGSSHSSFHHESPHTHSSGTSTHAPAPTASPIVGSCRYAAASGSEVDNNGTRYKIQCGVDEYNTGDIRQVIGKNFLSCMGYCDKTDKCIAYAWDGSICYLKGKVTGRNANPHTDYAYKDVATHLSASLSASVSASASASVHYSKPASSTPSDVVVVTVTSYTYSATPSSVSLSASGSASGSASVSAAPTPSEVDILTVTSYTYSATPSSVSSEYSSEESTRHHHHHHHHHHHTKSHGHYTESKNYEWIPSILTNKPHHTKSHHSKHHHHTTGSTVTDYVSETYTHTDFVTSVLPTASASVSASASVPAYTYNSAFGAFLPTQPYTPHPEQETTVADADYCLTLRQEQPKKLRVEIIDGSNNEFEGMYVKDPSRGKYRPIPA